MVEPEIDDFPYKKLYGDMKTRICERFMRLRKWRTTFECVTYRVNNAPDLAPVHLRFAIPHASNPPRTRTIPSNPQPIIMQLSAADYEAVNLISDFHIEQLRIKAYRGDDPSHESVAEYWLSHRDELEAAASRAFPDDRERQLEHMREAIYQRTIEVGTFRPSVMVGIVQLLREELGVKCEFVLNPCAGWGDRLLGLSAVGGIKGLVDVDPNTELGEQYPIMREWATRCVREHEPTSGDLIAHYKYFGLPFEDVPDSEVRALLTSWGAAPVAFDLVIAAPPYWTTEVYVPGSPAQSIERYNTFESWFRQFLLETINKGASLLRSGGIFALIINQSPSARANPRDRFLLRMIREMGRIRPSLRYLGVISYAEMNKDGRIRSPQPIWLWQEQ
jgi:hypothetical protein